jgi:hypothetical protein
MLTLNYANHARNTQRFEYIENSPEDVLKAVRDMVEIVNQGVKPETPEQRVFRLRVVGFCTRARAEIRPCANMEHTTGSLAGDAYRQALRANISRLN